MAIPSSGPISLTTVQTEFGGSNPIGINEYYAGGAYVAAGTTGTYGAVPSSGAISLQNFYGTSAVIPNYLTWMNTVPTWSVRPYTTRPSSVGGFTYWVGGGSSTPFITVTKINEATGAVSWCKRVTNPAGSGVNYQGNVTSVTDSSGNTYAIGKPNGGAIAIVALDSSGNTLSYNTPASASDTSSGDCVFATLSPDGAVIYFACLSGNVARFYSLNKSTLQFNWCYEANVAYSSCQGIVVDTSGNVYFGMYNSVFKLSNSGTLLANKTITFAGNAGRQIVGIGIDSSSNVYLISDTRVIVKYDSTLTTNAWAYLINVPDANTSISGFAVNASGTCIVMMREQAYVGGQYMIPRIVINSISSSGTLNYSNSLSYIFYLNQTTFADASSFYLATYFAGTSTSTSRYADLPLFAKFPIDGTAKGGYILGSSSLYYDSLGGSTLAGSSSSASSGAYNLTSRSVVTTTPTAPTNSASGNTFASQAVTASTTKASYTYLIPGSYTWICPAGVTSASAVAVGGGGGGGSSRGAGGGGGALGYRNNVTVTPGSSYTVVVGGGGATGAGTGTANPGTSGSASSVFSMTAGAGGGGSGNGGPGGTLSGTYTGGGNGGAGGGNVNLISGGGGGAGGYTGAGGNGGNDLSPTGTTPTGGGGGGGGAGSTTSCVTPQAWWNGTWGGGVGLLGLGSSGTGQPRTGTNGSGNSIGGGGGSYGLGGSYQYNNFGAGGPGGAQQPYYSGPCQCEYNFGFQGGGFGITGAVRIVTPGNTRTFPSTDVGTP